MIEQPKYLPDQIVITKTFWASFIVWLFQVSAIVGVYLGHQDWFIEKTPLNLAIQVVLLFWVFPIKGSKNTGLFLLLIFIGMLAECVGVATGFPFGIYSYGDNLGPKVLGVPILIGFNWAVLAFISGAVVNRVSDSIWIKSILAGLFLILLDIPMELLAPSFDFWAFQNEAPLENYVSWFLIGVTMQIIFQTFKVKGNFTFSINLLLAQLVFFVVLAFLL